MTIENTETKTETSVIAIKPETVPDKFWNMETGELNSDDLMKSYNALEKKFTSNEYGEISDIPMVPTSAADYAITLEDDLFEIDNEVNTRLHAAGFTNDQVQLVYDLAREQLAPMAHELTTGIEKKAQLSLLENQFGGKAGWSLMEKQLKNWGKSNLSVEVYESMSKNVDGVVAMHKMMEKNEPALLGGGHPSSTNLSESDLKNMMNDPRYWRDHDRDLVSKVRQGFARLYPG